MGDDEDAPKTLYTFLDPPPEEGEATPEVYLKTAPCKASVAYANGDKYVGEFNEYKQKHGQGLYSYYIKEIGEWLSLQQVASELEFYFCICCLSHPVDDEGEVLEEARAYTYEGNWNFNRKEGVGKLTYPNGDVYHGRSSLTKLTTLRQYPWPEFLARLIDAIPRTRES